MRESLPVIHKLLPYFTSFEGQVNMLCKSVSLTLKPSKTHDQKLQSIGVAGDIVLQRLPSSKSTKGRNF